MTHGFEGCRLIPQESALDAFRERLLLSRLDTFTDTAGIGVNLSKTWSASQNSERPTVKKSSEIARDLIGATFARSAKVVTMFGRQFQIGTLKLLTESELA